MRIPLTRARAASPEASASDYVALAERYKNLARLPLLPFQNSSFFDRFYPSAVSSLEAAVARPEVAGSPEAASVFATLALLYDERAQASDGEDRYLYAQLAADAAIRGLAAGHAEPGLRELAAGVLERASTLAQERGDAGAERDYRAQLESLRLGANGLTADDRERARLLDEASLAIERKDYRKARQILAGLSSPDAQSPETPAAPRISALMIETSTEPGLRRLGVRSWRRRGDGQRSRRAGIHLHSLARRR